MICGDDLRPKAERKTPANQLTSEERRTIIDTVNKRKRQITRLN